MSSGDGPLNVFSSFVDEPNRSPKVILLALAACDVGVDSVHANSVGDARKLGSSSFGSSSGGGEGSFGGGVSSLFFLIGYFLGSCFMCCGSTFSFVSLGLLKRSRELNLVSGTGCAVWDDAAFLRRSSASFANLDEPPSSFDRALGGSTGIK